ncbi:MAG: TonB-dependent receptor [Salinivirgaceae bacterium]|nr:TonB-dependent receptor [Salinivirgaceae bacterium]
MKLITLAMALSLLGSSFLSNAQISRDSTLESILDLSIEELMNTKVSIATKTNRPLSEAPSIVTVITEEVIKNSGARNIYDVLQHVPGFEFSRPRQGYYSIGVRGVKDILTNSRFLVLKDGVPYNGIMYGSGISSPHVFNIESIERIEVIRGPGSALYGRNAFIGVINIITKKAESGLGVHAYSKAGSFNTWQAGASVGKKNDNINAYFAADRIYSENTNSKLDDGFGGESLWNIGSNNYIFNTNIQIKDFSFTGMFSNIIDGASVGPFATESNKTSKIGVYALSYNKEMSSRITLSSKLYGRNENQVQNLEIYQPGMIPKYPNGAYVTPSFNSYTYGLDVNANYTINTNNQLLVGFQGDFYGVKDVKLKSCYDTYNGDSLVYSEGTDTLFRGKDTQIEEPRGWIENNGKGYSNFALYFQNIYTPFKGFDITLGGRFDMESEIGGVFNPRLGVVWKTNSKTIIKLLHGWAYRTPNVQEQYRLTGFTVGNKNLKPEKIKTTELSINYNITSKINNRLIIFYNYLNDIIYAQELTSGTPGSPYDNIGKNTTLGFEYESRMIFSKQLYAYLNYSFTYSMDKVNAKSGTEIYKHRDIAPHKINAGINYKFFEKFNFNSNLIYRSEREKYFVIDRNGDYVYENGNKTVVSQDNVGDYFLLNAKFMVTNIFKHIGISAEAYNIFNAKYYDQDTQYPNQPAREGRQLIISLSYNL